MRGPHPVGIVGVVLGALALAGCGEDPGIQQGTVPFKGTSTEGALDSLKDEMQKNMRNRPYLKRDDESGKPADASKGAGESKPAAESKPATKGG
jgi:hypothetical protein